MINHVQFPALGLEFTLNRVAFSLGGLDVYWYGIILALGLLAGMAFAFHYAVDFGIDSDRLVDVVVIGTVCGVACARIYYVAFAPFKYNSLWEMIDLRDGGIAIYGAVIGAFLFGGLACLWRKIPLLPTFDIVAISFLAGQGIGRWGNFMNQEAFGTNTMLPWGMISESTRNYLTNWQAALAAEGVTVDPSLPVHPTFLYESIWCLLGFVLLWRYVKKRRFDGEIALLYVVWYGAERFVVEGLRTDSLMLPGIGLRVSQVLALVSVAAALVALFVLRRKHQGQPLQVRLAVKDLKAYAKASPEQWDSLEANAAHREFVQAKAAWNEKIARLVAEAEHPADAQEPAQEPAEIAETAEPAEAAEPAPSAEEPDTTDENGTN